MHVTSTLKPGFHMIATIAVATIAAIVAIVAIIWKPLLRAIVAIVATAIDAIVAIIWKAGPNTTTLRVCRYFAFHALPGDLVQYSTAYKPPPGICSTTYRTVSKA